MVPGALPPDAARWLEGLRGFAASPGRDPGGSPAATAAEKSILAAHLVAWIDTEWPALLAERAAHGAGREPALVLTTSVAGIEAAAEVLGRDDPLMRLWRERFAAVTERDYRLWCIRHPDPDHRLHVNHWSWIKTRVPPQRQAAFSRWPLGPREAYWLHRTGTSGAGRDRRFCHLWKWNGGTAALLKPFIAEGVGGL